MRDCRRIRSATLGKHVGGAGAAGVGESVCCGICRCCATKPVHSLTHPTPLAAGYPGPQCAAPQRDPIAGFVRCAVLGMQSQRWRRRYHRDGVRRLRNFVIGSTGSRRSLFGLLLGRLTFDFRVSRSYRRNTVQKKGPGARALAGLASTRSSMRGGGRCHGHCQCHAGDRGHGYRQCP